MDDDGWNAVRPFAQRYGINYRLALSGDDVAEAYGGLGALPATFLIDRQGRIAVEHVGIVAVNDYQADIERLLAEK